MKAKRIFLLVLGLFCLIASLGGCTASDETTLPAVDDNEQAYINRIAQLEAALQKEREERYIGESQRDARIEALQQRLDSLEQKNDVETDQSPEGEELVFSYRVENGKAIITAFEGVATLVTVPATLDGYPVVAIGERAFEGKPIAAVILPEGLEAVGWFAFYGCENLHDITVPTSVTSIGYAVFDGCEHVSIVCKKGSYAAQYAESYGLPCVFS